MMPYPSGGVPPSTATGPEVERLLQERGRKLLEARRHAPDVFAYTAEDAAILQSRGRHVLQQHRQGLLDQAHSQQPVVPEDTEESTNSSVSSSAHGMSPKIRAPLTSDILVPLREQQVKDAATIAGLQAELNALQGALNGEKDLIPRATADRMREDLISQFNAHMAQCEQSNRDYWSQVMQHHQKTVAALTAAKEAAEGRAATAEDALAKAENEQRDTLATLHLALKETEAARDRAKFEATSHAERANDLSQQMGKLEAELAQLQTVFAHAEAEAKDRQQCIITQHEAEVGELQARLAELEDEVKSHHEAPAAAASEAHSQAIADTHSAPSPNPFSAMAPASMVEEPREGDPEKSTSLLMSELILAHEQMAELQRTMVNTQDELRASQEQILRMELVVDVMQRQLNEERAANIQLQEEILTQQQPVPMSTNSVGAAVTHGPSNPFVSGTEIVGSLSANPFAAAVETTAGPAEDSFTADSGPVIDASNAIEELTMAHHRIARLEADLEASKEADLSSTHRFLQAEDEFQRTLDAERTERERLELVVQSLELAMQHKSQSTSYTETGRMPSGGNPFEIAATNEGLSAGNAHETAAATADPSGDSFKAVSAPTEVPSAEELAAASDRIAELEAELEYARANEADMRSTRDVLQADGDELQRRLDAECAERERLELVVQNLAGTLQSARRNSESASRTEPWRKPTSTTAVNPFAVMVDDADGEEVQSAANPFASAVLAASAPQEDPFEAIHAPPAGTSRRKDSAPHHDVEEELAAAYNRIAELETCLESARADEMDMRSTRNVLQEDGDEFQRTLDAERTERERLELVVQSLELAMQHKSQSTSYTETGRMPSGGNPFEIAATNEGLSAGNAHETAAATADPSGDSFKAVSAPTEVPSAEELAAASDRIAELEAELEYARANEADMRSTRDVLQADGDELQRRLDAECAERERLELVVQNLAGTLQSVKRKRGASVPRPGIPQQRSAVCVNPFAGKPSKAVFNGVPMPIVTSDVGEDHIHPSDDVAAAYDHIVALETQLEAAESRVEQLEEAVGDLRPETCRNPLLSDSCGSPFALLEGESGGHGVTSDVDEDGTTTVAGSPMMGFSEPTATSKPVEEGAASHDASVACQWQSAESEQSAGSSRPAPRLMTTHRSGMEKLGRRHADAQIRLARAETIISELRTALDAAGVSYASVDLSPARPEDASASTESSGEGGADGVLVDCLDGDSADSPRFKDPSSGSDAEQEGRVVAGGSTLRSVPTTTAVAVTVASSESMEDLGRQYADAQMRLLEANEEILRLVARIAELEKGAAHVTPAASTEATTNPFTCLQKPWEEEHGAAASTPSMQQLQCRVDELEGHLAQMEDLHDAELVNLAEEAADQLAESEDYYKNRVTELEELLAATDGIHPGSAAGAPVADTLRKLRKQVADLEAELESVRAQHDDELAAIAADIDAQMDYQDEVLSHQLEEQRAHYEGLLQAATAQQQKGEVAGAVPPSPALLAAQEDANEDVIATAEFVKLADRFAVLQEEYEAFQRDTEGLRARALANQKLDESLAAYEANAEQLQDLRLRLDSMSVLVEATQADLRDRDVSLADAQRQMQSNAIAHAQASARLETEVAQQKATVKNLELTNEELMVMLQQGASTVEATLIERQKQLTAVEQELLQSQLALTAATAEASRQGEDLEALRQTENALRQRLSASSDTIHQLEAQLRGTRLELEAEARKMLEERDRLTRDGARREQSLQEQLAEARLSHGKEVEVLRGEVDALRDELQVSQTLVATLPLETQRQQNQFESVRQQLTEALQSNGQLHDDLHQARLEVQRQRALLRGLSGVEESPMESSSDTRVSVLLERNETLEERLRVVSGERNRLVEEKDALTLEANNAVRVADVKENAMRRQEGELRSIRSQVTALREDLAQRVQRQHALELELTEVHEHAAELANTYEDLQGSSVEALHRAAQLELAESLLAAKAASLPWLLHDYMTFLLEGLHDAARVSQNERRSLANRCNAIEVTAAEALEEGERQSQAYEIALADARDEQATLTRIIDNLHSELTAIEAALTTATAEAKSTRAELADVKRQSNESVFNAQRSLHQVELEYADSLNHIALLKEEVSRTAAVCDRQQQRYNVKEAELQEEAARLSESLRAIESDAKRERDQLTADRATLQKKMEDNTQVCDEATRTARGLQLQLDRALPRLAQLEEEHARRSADLMDTAQQLSVLSKKTTSEGEVSRRHIDELSTTLQQLMESRASLERAHTASESMVNRLKTQLNATEQDLERATSQRDVSLKELAIVSAKLKELEAAYTRDTSAASAQLREAQFRLTGLEQRNGVLQQTQQSLQDRVHQLQTSFDSTTDELRRVTDNYATQKLYQGRQLDSLRQRGLGLEEELHSLQTNHQTLSLKHTALERESQQLRNEVERLTQHLDDSNEYNSALNGQLAEQKAAHTAETTEVKATLEDAYKELNRCRQTIAVAEMRQVEYGHLEQQLRAETSRLREDLQAVRAHSEKAQQRYLKDQVDRQETVTALQSQTTDLQEQLRTTHTDLKASQLDNSRLEDTLVSLQREVRETDELTRRMKHEHDAFKEEVAILKELHRRERNELQSKLTLAEDSQQEITRQHMQYKEKMTNRVEMYDVSEKTLLHEVTDLRADVVRLEEALSQTKKSMHSAETQGSRQGHSLRAAEEELLGMRTQATKDMAVITHLQGQLQAAQVELERTRRDAASQLASVRADAEAERQATSNTLQDALTKERAAVKEARAAREKVLQSMDRRQREVEEMEATLSTQQKELRELQRSQGQLRCQLQAIEGTAAQAAEEAGLLPSEVSGSAHPATSTEPQAVLDALVDSLLLFRAAASALEVESAQVNELQLALRTLEGTMQTVLQEASGAEPPLTISTIQGAAGVTPLRPREATPSVIAGLLRTPTRNSSAAHSMLGEQPPCPAMRTVAGQAIVQQIRQSCGTFTHRVAAHIDSLQQHLRTLVNGIGRMGDNRNEAAAVPRIKLLVAATTADLHRRTAILTRALQRILVEHADASANAPGLLDTTTLQEVLRLFHESEQFALQPFNELLCPEDGGAPSTEVAPATGLTTLTQSQRWVNVMSPSGPLRSRPQDRRETRCMVGHTTGWKTSEPSGDGSVA